MPYFSENGATRGPIPTRVWLVVNIGTFNACICRNTASISRVRHVVVDGLDVGEEIQTRLVEFRAHLAETIERQRNPPLPQRLARLGVFGRSLRGRLAEPAAVDHLRRALRKHRHQFDIGRRRAQGTAR